MGTLRPVAAALLMTPALTPLPPRPAAPPAPAAQEAVRAEAPAPTMTQASERVIIPIAPLAAAEPAPETPAPSAVPEGTRPNRTPRPLAEMRSLPQATAEIAAVTSSKDGFNLMSIKESEGFIIQYSPPAVPADPLVLDLDGDGLKTSARRTLFDIDGDGQRDSISEVSRGDAVFVFDPDGDGRIGEDGGELFGDHTRIPGLEKAPADGYAALAELVGRAVADGLVPARTLDEGALRPEDLQALEDAWGLRVRVGGLRAPALRLSELGVVGLALGRPNAERIADYDGRGNDLTPGHGAEALFADGSRRAYGDLWLKRRGGELKPVLRAAAVPTPMR